MHAWPKRNIAINRRRPDQFFIVDPINLRNCKLKENENKTKISTKREQIEQFLFTILFIYLFICVKIHINMRVTKVTQLFLHQHRWYSVSLTLTAIIYELYGFAFLLVWSLSKICLKEEKLMGNMKGWGGKNAFFCDCTLEKLRR